MTAATLRHHFARLLDRPGGRNILAALTNRQSPEREVGVAYDEMWIDVVDGVHLPRSEHFNYYAYDLQRMRVWTAERLNGSFDYWAYVYKPKPGDIIIDIGAGVGVDALAFSPLVGKAGRIYSLEAHPWTFKALTKTVALNKLSNVTPVHLALVDRPGEVFISDVSNDEENTISNAATADHAIPVKSIDLDTFVAQHKIDHISLLKMNIEGAEALAIHGMKNSIAKVRNIVIACHDFRDDIPGTKEPVVEFLIKNGFTVTLRPDDPRHYVRDHVHGHRA